MPGLNLPPSIWSHVVRHQAPAAHTQEHALATQDAHGQQYQMAVQQQMQQAMQQAQAPRTPDMDYPSYPNSAGLGSQVPFEVPPPVVPVPAYHPPQIQPPSMPSQDMGPGVFAEHQPESTMSSWAALRQPNG